jgi:hypothetical protein
MLSINQLLARVQIDWRPRRSMVISTLLFLLGISIPVLMVLDILPFGFLLAFLGFALTASGGISWLIFYGEI